MKDSNEQKLISKLYVICPQYQKHHFFSTLPTHTFFVTMMITQCIKFYIKITSSIVEYTYPTYPKCLVKPYDESPHYSNGTYALHALHMLYLDYSIIYNGFGSLSKVTKQNIRVIVKYKSSCHSNQVLYHSVSSKNGHVFSMLQTLHHSHLICSAVKEFSICP